MDAAELLQKLAQLKPHFSASDLLRVALMLECSAETSIDNGEMDDAVLEQQVERVLLRLKSATDQHAAVADEIDAIAATAPDAFAPQQLWSLVRALKVQSQILNLYLEPQEAGV